MAGTNIESAFCVLGRAKGEILEKSLVYHSELDSPLPLLFS